MSDRPSLLHSSSFRLALVYMGLFGTSVLLLLGFIYWSTAAYIWKQADATLDAEITGLAERYRRDGLAGLSDTISERLSRRPTGSSIYLLTGRGGTPVVGNLNRWPDARPDADGWLDFQLGSSTDGREAVHRARARVFDLPGGYRLLVGRDLFELEEVEDRIIRALVWGLLMTLILAVAGGIMMSRSSARRIEQINRTARRIMNGDLSQRIPVRHTGDEFDDLAQNLNHMLDRIQSLMENVRRVSDNIAHDLRTPLARLRNRLETLRRQSEQAGGDPAMIQQAIAESDRLLATFNALLRIARIETRERRDDFEPVEMEPLLRDLAEFYQPLAEENHQQLQLETVAGVRVPGDRDLLFQAVANLVDNAIKYTPPGGHILLRLRRDGDHGELVVADNGPGIPEQERDRVFQRFYRLEQSRTTEGSGLGLSLVQAVAAIHDIGIELQDNHPGLRVVLQLPLDRAQPSNPPSSTGPADRPAPAAA